MILRKKLPDKWYVCPETEENLKIIKPYFIKERNYYKEYRITNLRNCYLSNFEYRFTDKDDYLNRYGFKEISMEEFKKFILNENIVIEKENLDYFIPILKELNETGI